MTIKEEYLLSFGRVVWSFADLEYHYQRVLVMADILNVETSIIITKKLSFSNLIELTNELLKNKFRTDENLIKEIDGLFAEAKDVNQQRNEITHSQWLGSSISDILHKYNVKKDKIEEFSPEKINKVADNIMKLDSKLISFIRKYFEPKFR